MNRIAFALILLATAAIAVAGPVKTTDIAPDAKWVVHVDVEAAVASQIGQGLLNTAKERRFEEHLQHIVDTFGFDPTKDLASVTLYGTSFQPAEGVAIFKGKFNKDKLLGLAAANEGHSEITYGDYKIQRWTETSRHEMDNGVRYGVFHDDGTVVIGHSEDALKSALDVLDHKVAGTSSIVPDLSPGTFIFAAGNGLPAIPHGGPHAQMFKKLSGGVMQMGESGDSAFLKVKLTAKETEDGDLLRQMIGGMLAFATMATEPAEGSDQPAPPWAALVQGAEVGGTGKSVELNVTVKTQTLIDAVKAAHHNGGPAKWRGRHHGESQR